MVTANPDLRDALSDPARSTEDKAALVDTLLDGKVLPGDADPGQAGARGHLPHHDRRPGENYRQVAASVQGRGRGHRARGAHVSDASASGSARRWRRSTAREIHLNEIVDPSVLGGMRVEIGDDVFDATVSSRLDDARRKLAG